MDRYADHIYRSYQVEKYGMSPADAEDIVRTLRANNENYDAEYRAYQRKNSSITNWMASPDTLQRMRDRAFGTAAQGNSKG